LLYSRIYFGYSLGYILVIRKHYLRYEVEFFLYCRIYFGYAVEFILAIV
jgi:hypothetical protein